MTTIPEIHLSVVTAIDQITRGYAAEGIKTLMTLRDALEADGTSIADVTTSPARSTDPETSKDAAKRVSPTNHLGKLLRVFTDATTPLTSYEACELAGISESASPWKRCSELKAAGIVEPVGIAVSPTTGRNVETYSVTLFGRLEAERIMGGES